MSVPAQDAHVVAGYEAGKRDGSLGTMKKIADALRIGLDDLV